jgi:four helix bundle protein
MTNSVQSFVDLKVWQKGMELVPEIYRLTEKLPKQEDYGLTAQIRRAAVSIPTNIAEGHGRQHTGEFLQYLSIARGSLAELQTLLILTLHLNYLREEQVNLADSLITDVRMLLFGLMRRLQAKV